MKRSDIQYDEVRVFIQKFLAYREHNIPYKTALNKSLKILSPPFSKNSSIEKNELSPLNSNIFQPPFKFYRDHYFPNNKQVVYEDDVFDPLIKVDRRTVKYKASRKRAESNSNYIVLSLFL